MFDNFFSLDIPGEIISSLIVVLIIIVLSIIIAIQAHFQDPLKALIPRDMHQLLGLPFVRTPTSSSSARCVTLIQ